MEGAFTFLANAPNGTNTSTRGEKRGRKRAVEACAGCRARKVRCDVIGQFPCVRCQLEGCDCVTTAKQRSTSTSDSRVVHQQQNDFFLASHFGFSPATLALTSMPLDTIVGDTSLDIGYNNPGGLNYCLTDPPTPEREREGANTIAEALAMGDSPFIDPTFTQEFSPLAQLDGSDMYKLSHLAEDDVAYLKSKNVFNLPPKEVQDELVNNYFLYIHPLLPIMKEKDFRDDYETNLSGTSLLLYRAMIFVATSLTFWAQYMSKKHLEMCEFNSISEAQDAHFTRAKLLYDFDAERNILPRLQATLLFSYWAPQLKQSPSRINIHWLSLAIVMAKELGMHQDAGAELADKKLRRRIWWSCIFRDVVLAFTYRRPPMIHAVDHVSSPLYIEDVLDGLQGSLAYSEPATRVLAKLFIRLSNLAAIASRLLESRYSPRSCTTTAGDPSSTMLDGILDMERSNTEFKMWKHAFMAEDFSYLDSEEGAYRPLMLHRNFILILHNAFIIIANQPRRSFLDTSSTLWNEGIQEVLTTSWERTTNAASEISALVKELIQLGLVRIFPISFSSIIASAAIIQSLAAQMENQKQLDNNSPMRICLYALDAMKQRFPIVHDLGRTLDAIMKLNPDNLTQAITLARQRGESLRTPSQTSEKTLSEFSNIFAILNFFDTSVAIQGAVSKSGLPNETFISSVSKMSP
ncbi:fungal-specific transcription factor domain-containing protein [Dactylonectria macrodidyma]|uniref:Fungal-specific transcription factor domain-containing protein n=1 Tax=Dactylonectria macrodidyma TaxID=307937 RepID=A0A9P9I6M1_9HYPO|nr:fungal-specific transcription factor domain-containing protein [Dactylonectria macrodidyma]